MFVGVVNYDTEFGNDFRLFIKYPGILNMYVAHPSDIQFETQPSSDQVIAFEKTVSRYNQHRFWNQILPLVLIEMFFMTLFINTKGKYPRRFIMVDMSLFCVSYLILGCVFYGIMQFNFDITVLLSLNLLVLLIINYLIWNKFRLRCSYIQQRRYESKL